MNELRNVYRYRGVELKGEGKRTRKKRNERKGRIEKEGDKNKEET